MELQSKGVVMYTPSGYIRTLDDLLRIFEKHGKLYIEDFRRVHPEPSTFYKILVTIVGGLVGAGIMLLIMRLVGVL